MDRTSVAGASAAGTVGSAAATVQYRVVDAAGKLGATGTVSVPPAGAPRPG